MGVPVAYRDVVLSASRRGGDALAARLCRFRCTGHSPTLLGTAAARLRTSLAMGLRMPRALRAACLAYVRTQAAKVPCVPAVARHVSGRHSADRSAVHIQANALRHHLDVVLLQTRARAVVASIGARVARFDARLIVLGAHGVAPLAAEKTLCLMCSLRRAGYADRLARSPSATLPCARVRPTSYAARRRAR
jgi:hypothetical protein